TVVHVEHAAAVGLFENGVLRLAFGADKQNPLPARGEIGNECGSFLEELERLLQVNDVDPIALAEDVLLHLRIPALGLMTEVHASFQKLFHRNRDRQVNPPLCVKVRHPERERGTGVGGWRRSSCHPPTPVPRYARDDNCYKETSALALG